MGEYDGIFPLGKPGLWPPSKEIHAISGIFQTVKYRTSPESGF